ncbi:restriction endonuclease subunit R [Subtercola sp. YIM 133946]|uniref:restriction endonuclease subunit R n=1 Tax=Subtercola sp. YIM 133946 TaxID=3118909 RepID=UPI002F92BA0D
MTDDSEHERTVPERWLLGASSFSWTPDIMRAEKTATAIVRGIAAERVASTLELEPGSVWRSFPVPTDAEVDDLRSSLTATGGAVSIVGLYIDEFTGAGRRRTEAERLAFVLPQIRAAHRLGATGVRLPIGQAGSPLLRELQPVLHELDLTLYEEIQGQQTLSNPTTAEALETIDGIADPRIRVIFDISILMPALPVSYLQLLAESGLPAEFVDRVTNEWRDPDTQIAVVALLHSGQVPPSALMIFMNMIVRFGRSDIAAVEEVWPLVGGFHLKFWDLDDADKRVSRPVEALGRLLRRRGFTGTLTSEWGGHEWLERERPTQMTRDHLALVRRALTA